MCALVGCSDNRQVPTVRTFAFAFATTALAWPDQQQQQQTKAVVVVHSIPLARSLTIDNNAQSKVGKLRLLYQSVSQSVSFGLGNATDLTLNTLQIIHNSSVLHIH